MTYEVSPLPLRCLRALGRAQLVAVLAFFPLGLEVAVAQDGYSCVLGFRGGLRPVAGTTVVAQGGPTGEMRRGGAVATDLLCSVSESTSAGIEVEVNWGPSLTLYPFLPTIGLRLPGHGGAVEATARVGLGWTWTGDGWADHILLPPRAGDTAIDPGVSGPVLGVGLHYRFRLSGRLGATVGASWRGSLLRETLFDGTPRPRKRTKIVHVLPFTAGLAIGL